MACTKVVFLQKLKPASVDEYLKLHQKVWPDLEETYREHGILDISCFVDGTDLMVLWVTDDSVYPHKKAALAKHPVEKKWQALMKSLKVDPSARIFEEIYRFPQV